MKVAFWSEEDGCGTTSSMAAVASVCSDAWKLKTVLLQSRSQSGDLKQKLESGFKSSFVREETSYYALDGLDYLLWQEKNRKLNEQILQESMVPVVAGWMYYVPQGERRKPQIYSKELKEAMCNILAQVEKQSDLTFIDCGSGEDDLSAYLLQEADVVAVNFSQERQGLDSYFQQHHRYHGRVLYIINHYQQESIYNKKNLNRIYRLQDSELAVIPENPFFRNASDRGQIERFIRRHIHYNLFDQQFYFMKELMQTSLLLLKAAGLGG